MTARQRSSGEWDVWFNGLIVGGPFDTQAEALAWIREQDQ